MPTRHPGNAAKNHSQPCSDPEATPPTNAPMLQPKPRRAPQPISKPPIAAAASDFSGGQGPLANGLLAAAAAIAPKSIPRSVRLEVSESTDSASARLGPGHCQNAACDRSNPSAVAAFAPQTVNANVTLHGSPPAAKIATHRSPITMPPIIYRRDGMKLAPRLRAMAMTHAPAMAMPPSVSANPPQAPR